VDGWKILSLILGFEDGRWMIIGSGSCPTAGLNTSSIKPSCAATAVLVSVVRYRYL
jgi:hypothetical protein